MPNYLQRIVASGARTTSGVKSNAYSRALIPPIDSSIHTPMSESEQRNDNEFSDPMMSRRDELFQTMTHESVVGKQRIVLSDVAPGKEQPPPAQMTDTSSNVRSAGGEAWAVTSDPFASTIRVRAPKGLRHVRSGNGKNEEIQAIEDPLNKVLPQIRVVHEGLAETSERYLQSTDGKGPQISRESSDQVEAVRVASHPTAQTEAAHGGSRDRVPATVETKPQAKQPSALGIVADNQIEPVHPIEVRAIVPRQTVPPVVGSAIDKPRRNEVSIGRIDVQVNNQTTPQPVGTQPTKQAIHSNFLDARYLSRFFLRL
jgi:hypothetical protein